MKFVNFILTWQKNGWNKWPIFVMGDTTTI